STQWTDAGLAMPTGFCALAPAENGSDDKAAKLATNIETFFIAISPATFYHGEAPRLAAKRHQAGTNQRLRETLPIPSPERGDDLAVG
ncbi:hypothetical protein, partial [Mesorhizobium sp.]|uniref:hypothetical protein n=1 Tax=Mesorhizobium sp. TaxID=1871066 RepID=UPI0025B8E671